MEIETFTHQGVEVALAFDEDPMSPREWSNIGTMLCNYRDYILGDGKVEPGEHESLEALLQWIREEHGATIILPLYILDHSGLAMSAGPAIHTGFQPAREHFLCDPGGWDTSLVGFIFDTPEGLEECGTPDDLKEALRGEVKTYDLYLQGQVFGYVVEGGESCWGFYDLDEARAEAKGEAEWVAEQRARALAERNAAEIATFATYAWTPEPV